MKKSRRFLFRNQWLRVFVVLVCSLSSFSVQAQRRMGLQEFAAKQYAAQIALNPKLLEFSIPEAYRPIVAKYLNPDVVNSTPLVSASVKDEWLWDRIKVLIEEFVDEFVPVEAGFLPGGIPVEAFEAAKYPVTREIWDVFMGQMPEHVPVELRKSWNDCLDCPVTYVSWFQEDGTAGEIQEFLLNVNAALEETGCIYDIPTDQRLHYMIRADVTGTNGDRYSKGVTDQNLGNYLTYKANSQGMIQPVGRKALNAFQIELANVWKITKDACDIYPNIDAGPRMRGGCWNDGSQIAESSFIGGAGKGVRDSEMGFHLIRICPKVSVSLSG